MKKLGLAAACCLISLGAGVAFAQLPPRQPADTTGKIYLAAQGTTASAECIGLYSPAGNDKIDNSTILASSMSLDKTAKYEARRSAQALNHVLGDKGGGALCAPIVLGQDAKDTAAG